MHNVHTCKLATNVKNRPTKSIKMCAIEVEINSNSCKFELSDLEIGCGFKKIIFSNYIVRPQWIGGSARNEQVE